MALRLQAMGKAHYAAGFHLTLHEDALSIPLRWRAPRLIFVNSMSDLFQEGIPLSFIQQVFAVMTACSQHTFQFITKRPQIAASLAPMLTWSPNVWAGTSVEDASALWRVRELQRLPAAVRFLSVEPLLGAIPRLPLKGIHWVIVGGESGPGARPMDPDWVRHIRDRCVSRGVPFFFKQWGGTNRTKRGRRLDGRFWNQMPERPQQPRRRAESSRPSSSGTFAT